MKLNMSTKKIKINSMISTNPAYRMVTERFMDADNHCHILTGNGLYVSHMFDDGLRWKCLASKRVANIAAADKWLAETKKSIGVIKPYKPISDAHQYHTTRFEFGTYLHRLPKTTFKDIMV